MTEKASKAVLVINLVEERMNRGLSRRQAAALMNVGAEVLRRAEEGEGVHPSNQLAIAKYYGHEVTDIWPLPGKVEAAV
jgi:transcriptional regulator with XRE-family HTH domain